MIATRRTITLTVELPSGLHNLDNSSLRRFLKALGRQYHIRCVDLAELTSAESKGVAIVSNAIGTTQATAGTTSLPDAGDATTGASPAKQSVSPEVQKCEA